MSSPNEYLISLPYSERSRAKSISGYQWDPDRKLWRFPKTDIAYQSILAEFGPEETTWAYHSGGSAEIDRLIVSQYEESISKAEEGVQGNDALIAIAEGDRNRAQLIVDLWDTAERFGLPEDGNVEEFTNFTKAAYEGNYQHADLAVKLASCEVLLRSANHELSELRQLKGIDQADHFRQAIVQQAWGNSAMPRVIADFSFDSRGAIELQNFLSRMLSNELGKGNERNAFADLIREAEDVGLLNGNTARVCQTLRIQRNYFAHESVADSDVMPRACLCLFSFIIVYRDLAQPRQVPKGDGG